MVSTFCGNKMLSFAESKKKQIIKRDVRTIKWELCNVRCQTAAIKKILSKQFFSTLNKNSTYLEILQWFEFGKKCSTQEE
jgi:hypothetical protein